MTSHSSGCFLVWPCFLCDNLTLNGCLKNWVCHSFLSKHCSTEKKCLFTAKWKSTLQRDAKNYTFVFFVFLKKSIMILTVNIQNWIILLNLSKNLPDRTNFVIIFLIVLKTAADLRISGRAAAQTLQCSTGLHINSYRVSFCKKVHSTPSLCFCT